MNARVPPQVLQPALALERVSQAWDSDIVRQLTDYIAIPAKSPTFAADWAELGLLDTVVRNAAAWVEAQKVEGLKLEIVRIAGRTPVLRDELLGIGQLAALLEDGVSKLADPDRHGAQSLRLDEIELLLGIGQQRLRLADDVDGAQRAEGTGHSAQGQSVAGQQLSAGTGRRADASSAACQRRSERGDRGHRRVAPLLTCGSRARRACPGPSS